MNDPANLPISFGDMLEWLLDYRQQKHLSWAALARSSGIPEGTLTSIRSPSFQGNKDNIARRIFAFKQKVESQAARSQVALARPDFIETKTAGGLIFLMEWAQGGRMTAAAMGPGTGKTMTAEHYKASIGETVWLATMKKTTKSPTAMIAQVMRSMGLHNTSGWAQQRSGQVEEFVRGKQGLLIIDEANHLELDSFEEIRSWHDSTGLGVCLLGNEEMVARIRGGEKRHAYARLNSRIAHFHIQDLPYEEDAAAYLDAMDIDDPALRRPLIEVAIATGHGGLRELRHTLESAHMLAITQEQPLGIDHVRKAIASRTIDARRRRAA